MTRVNMDHMTHSGQWKCHFSPVYANNVMMSYDVIQHKKSVYKQIDSETNSNCLSTQQQFLVPEHLTDVIFHRFSAHWSSSFTATLFLNWYVAVNDDWL